MKVNETIYYLYYVMELHRLKRVESFFKSLNIRIQIVYNTVINCNIK